MLWSRIIWLFIMFILGRHLCFPSYSSERYLELADSASYYMSIESWDNAEQKIIEALRLEPANFSNSMLLANLGLIQTHNKKYHEAIKTLTLGLNIAPSSSVLLNNRAHAYLYVDSLSAAAQDLDRSLELDSVQEWPLQTRAFIYLHENQLDEAKSLLVSMKKFFPENANVYSAFASIAEKEGDYVSAKENYIKSLEINPEDEDVYASYIMLLIVSDQYSEARSVIKKALDINPENSVFYLLRGFLHKLNFRMDEAEADKKIAISKGADPEMVAKFIP